MVNPEWGIKRVCQSCATLFYDFDKSPIVCPSCGTAFDPEAVLKSRRNRAPIAEEPKPVRAKVKEEKDAALEDDDEDDDEEDTLDDEDEDEDILPEIDEEDPIAALAKGTTNGEEDEAEGEETVESAVASPEDDEET